MSVKDLKEGLEGGCLEDDTKPPMVIQNFSSGKCIPSLELKMLTTPGMLTNSCLDV
jgi:hypothetical protein